MTLDLARLREQAHRRKNLLNEPIHMDINSADMLALLDRLEAAEKTADAGIALHCAIISTAGDCADDRVCTADQELIDANAAWRALVKSWGII